jgi:hypothetical protein
MIFHRDLQDVRFIPEIEKRQVKIHIDAIVLWILRDCVKPRLKLRVLLPSDAGVPSRDMRMKRVPFPEAADKIHVASPRTRYKHPEKLRYRVNTLVESSQHAITSGTNYTISMRFASP